MGVVNRRDFLKLMGAGTATALAASPVMRALAAPDLPDALRVPALADTRDPVTHALNRMGFGIRPGQLERVRQMGLSAYVEQQLAPESIDVSASEPLLGDYITLDMTIPEMIAAGKQNRAVMVELVAATLLRAIYSERQLLEVMVNFWSDHFSIYHPKESCKELKTIDDREVIRKHALGNFRDLLGASAHSPAMLVYLDNFESRKEHPNENYARELLELHTLGVGNYTEQDVKEVARCLTGWSVAGLRDANPGEFMFRRGIHDTGQKTVLGTTIQPRGEQDGETVLDLVASHPATAKFIAARLCRRFVADFPPDSIVNAVAHTFTQTSGDIKAMLRTIFASPEFLNAPPKFKRPFEYVVSLARGLNVQQVGPLRPFILQVLKQMGHLPFDWPAPNGYPDVAAAWQDNLLYRWNTAIAAAYNQLRGWRTDLIDVAGKHGAPMTGRGIVEFYGTHLLGRALTTAEADALWKFASTNGEPNPKTPRGRRTLTDTVALIAASPAFQYR